MGFFDNTKRRMHAMKIGMQIMGEGMGWKAPGQGGGLLSAVQQLLSPKYGEPPRRGTEDWLKMFSTNPRLNPAYKIAQDVASAEWGLYSKRANEDDKLVESHPLIDLFNKPNPLPETTWFNLLFMTEAYLILRGEAFWIIERNGFAIPTELWLVPSHWVLQIPTISRPYFRVQVKDGGLMDVLPQDMVYFKEPDLSDPYGRGIGRAQGIEDEIETDEFMARWAKKFFYNDAKPPLVITAPGAQPKDVDRMEEKWLEKVGGGIKNAHKPAWLPFEGKVTELGQNQKDMDFIESRRFIRDLANQHFLVPPELMAIIENSNRATIDAADYIYKSGTLRNRLKRIADTVQNQLIVPHFGDQLHFCYKNIVPEDKEFKLKQSSEGVKAGTVMLDEWRQQNEMDPMEGKKGQVLLIPNTHTPTDDPLAMQQKKDSISEQAAQRPQVAPGNDGGKKPPAPGQPKPAAPKPQAGAPKPKKAFKILDAEQKEKVANIFDGAAEEQEGKMSETLQRFFMRQGKRAEIKMGELMKDFDLGINKADDADERAVELVGRLLVWSEEEKRMVEVMLPYWVDSAKAGHEIADSEFDLGVSFDFINEEMLDFIEAAGAAKVVGITNTTKKALSKTLAEGIRAGEGAQNLAKRVREEMGQASRYRSFVIARTESHNTMVRGAMATYKAAGIQMKQWWAVNDERTRETHQRVHGEKKSMNENFSNGCECPGTGPASEVIQCRCALMPVIDVPETTNE